MGCEMFLILYFLDANVAMSFRMLLGFHKDIRVDLSYFFVGLFFAQ